MVVLEEIQAGEEAEEVAPIIMVEEAQEAMEEEGKLESIHGRR